MKHKISALFIILGLLSNVLPIYSIDDYYNFPKQSYKGSITYESTRNLCLFSFVATSPDPTKEYLVKGIPSVLISELRNLEYTYVEHPKANVVYHSFGDAPEMTLQEKIDAESPNVKRKKKEITSEKDLDDLRSGKKQLAPEKDPRYIKVTLKQIWDRRAPTPDESFGLASKLNCDYMITGSFESKDNELITKVFLYDDFEGKTIPFEHKTSVIRAYQEMAPLGESIREKLQGKETTTVEVSASGEEGALVYLDGIYLGKTPMVGKKSPIGKRSLFVFKEGFHPYKQEVHLEKGKTLALDVKLSLKLSSSLITVNSNVESDVYFGIQYLGKTPLSRVAIPSGMNRLRVSKEGYIDSFRAVDAKDNEEVVVDIEMREGKTDVYYKNKQNVFLDHTYKDFATYSLYGSLLFYASYVYLNYASRQAYSAARSEVTLVNGLAITSFYQNNPNEFFFWYGVQNSIIDDAESKARNLKRVAGTLPMENRRDRQLVAGPMVIMMGIMLVSAATFYMLGIDEETLEFGYIPLNPSSVSYGQTSREGYGYMQFNVRY
ncbi:PEGA domain-containing protein [Leptospira kanakyensis]|uniref:PEGA domain-containing protein n=1 Tax=Leptospira kanakyensis TaxID=2484968 RepID=A0A6N4Q0R1_9LEPT|nr:PEGA domain-containing protein [Leptospira kanakyensis]MCW7479497.1 PEGA domain-containing protein [Leptospira kanakyensis]TGK51565.1 PEGA domain-containing protein [Leptospira kanakyensis]TGK58734.1 PEGA domain-containing protein [Leptospira kanakyensis]TGK70937.1 PEGA domain-containing protein [Leptospira kanakyensis]